MLASMCSRRPMIFALASNASSIVPTLSRPCSSARITSERSQRHFTGRSILRAAHKRQPVLDILPALRAEAAAHVAAHHADLALRHLEHHVGEHVAHAVRIVHVGVERVAVFRRIIGADRAARLHVLRVDARDHVAPFDDMRGLGECRLGRRAVAALGGVRDVVRILVPHTRRIRLRSFGDRRHRWQRIVVHDDEFRRVLRLRQRLGDHHRHRIADITCAIDDERGTLRREHRRAVALLARHRSLRHRNAVVRVVGPGVYRDHARRSFGRRGVDRADPRMRVRRAHEHAPGLPVQRLVVLIAALAGEQPHILEATDRLADAELHRGRRARDVVHAPGTSTNRHEIEPSGP